MSKIKWGEVGEWIKANAGKGAALIGALVTGGVPGAVAAGVSMISSVTGTNDPEAALKALNENPTKYIVELKQLANERKADIERHLEAMTLMDLEDKQAEHHETQETIRAGDKAADRFVRWTRPGQSWVSLFFAAAYAYIQIDDISPTILGLFLTLPFSYAGLRQVGKAFDSVATKKSQN